MEAPNIHRPFSATPGKEEATGIIVTLYPNVIIVSLLHILLYHILYMIQYIRDCIYNVLNIL